MVGHSSDADVAQTPVAAALAAAELGYRVMPVKADKRPHIKDWPRLATSDPTQVREWWARWPRAQVGIATGAGVQVVDQDVKHGHHGINVWTAWCAETDVAVLPGVPTPSGGRHVFYSGEGLPNRVNLLPGVDTRGAGGYVVAYDTPPPLADLPPLPAAVATLGRRRQASGPNTRHVGAAGVRAALERECDLLAFAEEGGRNHALNAAAYNLGQLVGDHLTYEDATARLMDAALDLGLPGDEAAATVASGLESGMSNPRDTTSTPAAPDILRTFARTSVSALLDPDRPPREYVVEPLLAAGSSVAFIAPAGHKKSLVALSLAVAVARGDEDWAGMAVPRARRVLYIDMELTEDDLAERLLSFGLTHGEDLPNLILVHLPAMAPLDTARGGDELMQAVAAYGLEPGDVVVLDSYQRVTEAGENDSDTTRAYYRHTGARLKAAGLTVLRTDNTGKDVAKGARGSSGKRDDVDVEYIFKAEGAVIQVFTGKVRQRGVEGLALVVHQHAGRTWFTSSHRRPDATGARECAAWLTDQGAPLELGQRPAEVMVKNAGQPWNRTQVRDAVKLRHELAADFEDVL